MFVFQALVRNQVGESEQAKIENFALRIILRMAVHRYLDSVPHMLQLHDNKRLLQLSQVLHGLLILHCDFRLLAELVLKPCVGSHAELGVDGHGTEELDAIG